MLTDNKDSNPALDPDELPFHHDGHAEDFDAIRTLVRSEQMRTRKVTLHDWDYKKRGSVGENTPTVLDIGADHELERYRYPGGFVAQSGAGDAEAGKHLSKVIMEAEESSHLRFRGDSQIRTLAPGHTFTLYDHPFDEFNVEYMILSVWHHGRNNLDRRWRRWRRLRQRIHPAAARDGLPRAADHPQGPGARPADRDRVRSGRRRDLHRRARPHQGPLPLGPQGAGPSTDKPDDKASCWIRVAQMWAGNGYGTMFIPRIGMEVVVDFLEGDPDKPIAVGCVYNGINKPPYALPGEATKSTIKTLSSKGGGGTNELRFEDKKGSEEVFLQAQKDFNTQRQGRIDTESSAGHARPDQQDPVRAGPTSRDDHTTVDRRSAFGTRQAGRPNLKAARRTCTVGSQPESVLFGKTSVVMARRTCTMDVLAARSWCIEAGRSISLKVGGSVIVIDPSGRQHCRPDDQAEFRWRTVVGDRTRQAGNSRRSPRKLIPAEDGEGHRPRPATAGAGTAQCRTGRASPSAPSAKPPAPRLRR